MGLEEDEESVFFLFIFQMHSWQVLTDEDLLGSCNYLQLYLNFQTRWTQITNIKRFLDWIKQKVLPGLGNIVVVLVSQISTTNLEVIPGIDLTLKIYKI